MAERNRKPDQPSEVQQARTAARAAERAAAHLVEFADRVSPAIGSADMVEYDTLIAREATAVSERVEAFGRLGFGAPSLDATGRADD